MKTLLAALFALGLGLACSGAEARSAADIFTDIARTSPRSIFDDIRDSAPRSDGVFGQLQRNAP